MVVLPAPPFWLIIATVFIIIVFQTSWKICSPTPQLVCRTRTLNIQTGFTVWPKTVKGVVFFEYQLVLMSEDKILSMKTCLEYLLLYLKLVGELNTKHSNTYKEKHTRCVRSPRNRKPQGRVGCTPDLRTVPSLPRARIIRLLHSKGVESLTAKQHNKFVHPIAKHPNNFLSLKPNYSECCAVGDKNSLHVGCA